MRCNSRNVASMKGGARRNCGTALRQPRAAPGFHGLEQLSHSLARFPFQITKTPSLGGWGSSSVTVSSPDVTQLHHFRHTETPLSTGTKSQENKLSGDHEFAGSWDATLMHCILFFFPFSFLFLFFPLFCFHPAQSIESGKPDESANSGDSQEYHQSLITISVQEYVDNASPDFSTGIQNGHDRRHGKQLCSPALLLGRSPGRLRGCKNQRCCPLALGLETTVGTACS
ncbi:uncharacterized protein B0H64DRAFT_379132 [Chaetomium fimeti]|uniref:Uncharacterized protein n=1 Tax=Chaetomium fimeti TaxID=1854472 RepID=A0AAE0HP31_9PEZI|nr:hypothetical protein B0H64DRAFT_379132 [Chaetomium fimeti]